MASTTNMESTPKEMGLIKNLARRNGELAYEKECHAKAKREAMNMLWKMSKYSLSEKQRLIIEYLENTGTNAQAYLPTKIDEYINKKGVKSMAHYNQNGKYISSVKAMGDRPYLVLTWTPVTIDKIDLWIVSFVEAEGRVKLTPIKNE